MDVKNKYSRTIAYGFRPVKGKCHDEIIHAADRLGLIDVVHRLLISSSKPLYMQHGKVYQYQLIEVPDHIVLWLDRDEFIEDGKKVAKQAQRAENQYEHELAARIGDLTEEVRLKENANSNLLKRIDRLVKKEHSQEVEINNLHRKIESLELIAESLNEKAKDSAANAVKQSELNLKEYNLNVLQDIVQDVTRKNAELSEHNRNHLKEIERLEEDNKVLKKIVKESTMPDRNQDNEAAQILHELYWKVRKYVEGK